MTDFNFPTRFDEKLADDGVWFDVVDENDAEWGSFKCNLVDKTLPRFRLAVERLQRKYKNKKVKDFTAELLVELALLDWNLKDAKGAAISYTKDKAVEYFSMPQAAFVLGYLSPRVEDVRNFQPDDQEELPEGN